MTPQQRAAERGHLMQRLPTVLGRDQWTCRRCGLLLLADAQNPRGWGRALSEGCLEDAA